MKGTYRNPTENARLTGQMLHAEIQRGGPVPLPFLAFVPAVPATMVKPEKKKGVGIETRRNLSFFFSPETHMVVILENPR